MHIELENSVDFVQLAREERNPFKKFYFWCLHWARTRYAIPALFVLSFAESSFFPLPPDILLIAICFAKPRQWWNAALWCTIASVLGGVLGYYIGYGLYETIGEPIVKFYHGEAVMVRLEDWYREYGFLGILLAAITPIPYKVFTIASGVFHFEIVEFIVASTIGRGFRFFLVAGLAGLLGEKVRPFLEERFNTLMIIVGIIAILGFVVLKYL